MFRIGLHRSSFYGIVPRNAEQSFAVHSLFDNTDFSVAYLALLFVLRGR